MLRTALFGSIIFLALETLKSSLSIPQPLFVIFDNSESMKIGKDGLSKNASESLPSAAEKVILEEFPEREIHVYELFRDDDETEVTGSPISEALIRFINRSGIESGQELVLFSDGQDSTYPGMPIKAAKYLRQAGIRARRP